MVMEEAPEEIHINESFPYDVSPKKILGSTCKSTI
jgi:hypothetical protein